MNYGARLGSFDWLYDDSIRVVAIVGICKNAGKTTLLNYLLQSQTEYFSGVFSTGIDGEETDTVFRTHKPRVNIPEKSLFCCDTAQVDGLGASVSIICQPNQSNVLRPLWLVKAETQLQAEITGPSSVSEQVNISKQMLLLGAGRVYIDGSLDRKSITLSRDIDAVIMVLGASFGSIKSIQEELKRLTMLNNLAMYENPIYERGNSSYLVNSEVISVFQQDEWTSTGIHSMLGYEKKFAEIVQTEPECLYIPGAITDDVFKKTKNILCGYKGKLIFSHPDCLKLSLGNLEQFLSYISPEVVIPYKIRSFVLNSEGIGSASIDADLLNMKLRNAFPGIDIKDIRKLR